MKLSTLFPSKWLRHADLAGQNNAVVIDRLETEVFDGDGEKPVLFFRGRKKGLVLNKTNAYAIGRSYGEDTSAWADKPIVLAPARVEYKGKLVDSIRVQIPERLTPAPTTPAPATPAPAPMPATGAAVLLDDEIPF